MNILFFKLALRNIFRNKFYSLINIVGFSIGIATVFFIFLFVRHETSFDNFHPDRDRLYRVTETWKTRDNHSISGFTCYPEAPEIKNTIPGVEDFCRITETQSLKCYNADQLFSIEKLRVADDNFFSFFDFKLTAGDPESVLNSADKIVLTKSTALRIFGPEDPLGKVLTCNQRLLTVSGIAEELPSNTHLKFDAMVSIRYMEQDKENYYLGWTGGVTFLAYLKLMQGTTPAQVEAGLPDLFYQRVNKAAEGQGFKLSANLQNIREVHLTTGENRYDCSDNRSKSSIMIIALIGLLILILAIVNYISLYVAQKSEKIRDISLLSIHGAGRPQLTLQAFIEVMFITAFSSLIGLVLFLLVRPFLNNHLNTEVALAGNLLAVILFLVILIPILSLIVTLFSTHGILKFRIADTIKDSLMPGGHKSVLGNVLVTFQFTIVVVLIISGLFINRQNKYVLNRELGFNKENVLSLVPDQEFKHDELQTFRQELKKMPEISHVSLTSQGVGNGVTMNGYTITGETEVTMINAIYADQEFLDCFGIRLNSGRNFKENIIQDKNSILINETMAKRGGWSDPLNQTINRNGLLTVIGTVQDFNFASLYSEIRPLLIMRDPSYDGWGYGCVNIRYQTADIRQLVSKIRNLWEDEFPGIPYEVSFLNDQLAKNYTSLVAQQKIVTFFSVLAILIACMGLFGLTSIIARRRTKEIGIRRVNGAEISELMLMLNRDFLKWVLLAIVIAVPVAWYVMNRWMEGFAYRAGLSWWVFGLAGVMVLLIALLTVSYQSFRASTRNPVDSLRHE